MEVETEDDLGDWRVAWASRLMSPIPAAFPGGPSHEVGSVVHPTALVRSKEGIFGFIYPSAPALALGTAYDALERAKQLHAAIEFRDVLTPEGDGKRVTDEHLGTLYDFLQQCMITATFSYQALESFCNHSISSKLKEPILVKRRKKNVLMNAQEIERQISTAEKLATIMPKLFDVSTPKGKHPWQKFKELQDARDGSIHLKANDQNVTYDDSLFMHFLESRYTEYPQAALAMLKYFLNDEQPRWLKILENSEKTI